MPKTAKSARFLGVKKKSIAHFSEKGQHYPIFSRLFPNLDAARQQLGIHNLKLGENVFKIYTLKVLETPNNQIGVKILSQFHGLPQGIMALDKIFEKKAIEAKVAGTGFCTVERAMGEDISTYSKPNSFGPKIFENDKIYLEIWPSERPTTRVLDTRVFNRLPYTDIKAIHIRVPEGTSNELLVEKKKAYIERYGNEIRFAFHIDRNQSV